MSFENMGYELVDTILYTGEDGSASIKMIIDSDNNAMWTTQQSMAKLLTEMLEPSAKI